MADTWDYKGALATFWIACVSYSSGQQGMADSQPLSTLPCTKLVQNLSSLIQMTAKVM